MTTKVLIVNLGPKIVSVDLMRKSYENTIPMPADVMDFSFRLLVDESRMEHVYSEHYISVREELSAEERIAIAEAAIARAKP